MALLHLVRQSAFNSSDLAQCLMLATPKDTIVLLDDGCYNVSHPLIKKVLNDIPEITIEIIQNHAQARAIEITEPIKAIAMENLVELTFTHEKVITWQ